MSTAVHDRSVSTGTALDPARVGVRTTLAGLWTAVMFVFAYVDLFSWFRADYRAAAESGVVAGFTVNGFFLLWITTYVTVPSLMIVASLLLPARAVRVLNLALAPLYTLTIVAAAVGEMGYFVLGSVVEVALLLLVVRYAWAWPRTGSTA